MRRRTTVVALAVALAATAAAEADGPVVTGRIYSPIADVDGDGADDLFETVERLRLDSQGDDEVVEQVVRVRSSRDHSVLWEWERTPDMHGRSRDVHLVRFGPDERPAVTMVVTRTSSTPVPQVTHRSVTLDAATGLLLSRTELTTPSAAAATRPVVADVLPGGAHELVAYRSVPGGTVLDVVDGRTGTTRQIPIASTTVGNGAVADDPGAPTTVEVVDDVDGDGLDDLVVRTGRPTGPVELQLVSLGDETPITHWSRTIDASFSSVDATSLGDATGDGVADVMLRYRLPDTAGTERMLLDGATGATVASFPGSHGWSTWFAGDVDGEPGGEIAIHDGLDVRFVRADGTQVAAVDLRPHQRAMVGDLDRLIPLGDVDGDGRHEFAVEHARYGSGQTHHSVIIVDGVDVQLIEAGTVRGLPGTGHLVNTTTSSVVLRDAVSLEPVWEAGLAHPGLPNGPPTPADLTGDGTPDLLFNDGDLRTVDGSTGAARTIASLADGAFEWTSVEDLRR